MKKLVLCLLLMLFVLPMPAHAQEDEACEPDFTAAGELWDSAQTAVADGEWVAAWEAFRELRRELARVESACLGLNMAGDGGVVTDVVIIPEGTYRVTMVAEDSSYTSVTLSPLDGECGETLASARPGLLVFGTEAELQAVFVSEGCEAIMDITATGEWTIEWDKIK